MAVVALASRFLDPEAVANLLEPRMEKLLGREVEISTAKVGFFPLAMTIQEITVSDPTGLAPELASIESAEFQVALLPLLRRQVRVRGIIIRHPEAHLHVAADGSSNFGDFSSASTTSSEASAGEPQTAMALDLRGIRVLGGVVSLVNDEASTTREIRGLSLDADVEHAAEGPWIFTGTTRGSVTLSSTRERTVSERGPFPVELAFDAEASWDFQELAIRTGQLMMDPVSLALSGEIKNLQNPVRTLALRLEGEGIPLSEVFEALPGAPMDSLQVRGEGIVSLLMSAEGEVGQGVRPELSGSITLAGGSLLGADDDRLAQYLTAHLTFLPGDVLGVEAEGEVMDGPFSLDGTVGLVDLREVDLRLDAYPDLSQARSILTSAKVTELQGRIRANLRITGSALEMKRLRFWGDASPSELRVTHSGFALPITLHEGAFILRGESATFQGLALSLGRDRFLGEGAVGNLPALGTPGERLEVRGNARGARLDLTTLKPRDPPDPNLTYGKVAFAHLGGRGLSGMTVQEAVDSLRLMRPDSLPLAGDLTLVLDTLIDARGRMEDVRARMVFGPDFFRIADASFRRYGGTLQASMNMQLGRNAQEAFSLRLNAVGVEAPAFLTATSSLGSILRGDLSLQLEVAGTLDTSLLPDPSSLVGSGSFSIRDGGLNTTVVTESLATFLGMDEYRAPDFQDWSTSFLLRDGRVQLAGATMVGAPGEPRIGGGVGLDGGLDLVSAFSLPTARLGTYAKRNLGMAGEIADRVANRPDVIQAAIRIGGSVLRPDLEADPSGAMAEIGGAVGAEVRAETERQIQQQTTNLQNRASSFLRGILRRPDTVRPDTIRPDTIRPDTIRPDTIRPDTVRPDTVRPDTLPPDTVRIR
jgi:hypothetical protein